MATRPKPVTSIEQLQRHASAIMNAIQADQALAQAALANPILALDAVGFPIDPALRPALERRVRFSTEAAARLDELEREVHAAAGHEFDIDDPHALHTVLVTELNLGVRAEPRTRTPVFPKVTRLPPQPGWAQHEQDPLEACDRSHPIIAPLLEYRQLEASQPRLASSEMFERIRDGRTKTFVTKVSVSFHRPSSDR